MDGRCRLCRAGITEFERAWAWGEYDGALRALIHLLKYDRVSPLAEPLGALMALGLPRGSSGEAAVPDVIVPMPLHWRRRLERGFNQAELLARVVGKRTGIPVEAGAAERRKATPPQAGLTNAQRRLNVSGAFEVKEKDLIRGHRVLLVDDVLTTGATASACSAALRRAGATSVSVLTLARVDRRKGISGRFIS